MSNPKPRNLSDVAGQIHVTALPHDESFAASVLSVKTSAEFAAPEMMHLHWGRLGEAFQDHFPEDPSAFSDWQKECVEILQGKKLSL